MPQSIWQAFRTEIKLSKLLREACREIEYGEIVIVIKEGKPVRTDYRESQMLDPQTLEPKAGKT